MKTYSNLCLLLLMIFTLAIPRAFAMDAVGKPMLSVSRFGITWTFDRAVEAGQFVNGDWWVLGPVTVTEITPASEDGRNGSMINPAINKDVAFDSRIQRNNYDAEKNVALQLPLRINKPASLLSSISVEEDAVRDDPQIDTIAILTVLKSRPPEGSFRPPYQGDDKSIPGTIYDLDLDILRNLKPVEGAPVNLSSLAKEFERPWIELKLNWTGRYTHPKQNQPTYGRELAGKMGLGLLALQLDYPNKEKQALLINMVQIGIDIYGAVQLGGSWDADGGHNQGRKLPLLFAGKLLGNKEMLAYADAGKNMIFQEDQQTFYVEQKHIDTPRSQVRNRPREDYVPEMLGMPEWGIRNYRQPELSGSNWNAYYRQVSGAPTTTHVLVAHLMGLEADWNHPPIFEYYDRYFELETDPSTRLGKGANGISEFTENMWNAYREQE